MVGFVTALVAASLSCVSRSDDHGFGSLVDGRLDDAKRQEVMAPPS